MPQEEVITEEMRRTLGSLMNITITEIERGHVRRVAEATEDPNPLYRDEEFARRSEYGGIIAPPGLLITMQMEGGTPSGFMPFEEPLKRALDGGGEWEFYKPVRPGDVITVSRKLVDLSEKRGKLGPMVFNTFEVTYMNQRDEVVARGRWTSIRY